MFLLGRLWFGNWGGWLAAAAYIYAPYFHVDLFVRQALAEFAAFPFYPLAFYGFARYVRGRDLRFLLLGAIGYAGVIAAHHPAAFLFSPLLLSFAVFQAAQNKSLKLLLAQCAGIALGLGLGASVWLPGLFERQFVKLDRLLDGYLQYTNHFVYLQQLIETSWGYGLSLPGYEDGMSFSLGWSHLLLAVLGWVAVGRWLTGRERRDKRRLLGFLSAWCILLSIGMLAGSEWFWAKLPLMKYIEFPWRMLAPACFCLALLVASAAAAFDELKAWRKPAMIAAFALLTLPNLHHIAAAGYQTLDLGQWTSQQIARRGISVTTRNEYEPLWAERPAYRPETVLAVAGAAQGEMQRLTPAYWAGQVEAASESSIEISCFYFPGWQASIDGREIPTEPSPAGGLILVNVPEGRHNLELRFGRTPARMLAETISAISVLVLAGLWWWTKRKRFEAHAAAGKVSAGQAWK
jgi:hypothetical protein